MGVTLRESVCRVLETFDPDASARERNVVALRAAHADVGRRVDAGERAEVVDEVRTSSDHIAS
jgi:hypothetical protein